MMVDVKTLEILAATIRSDCASGAGLSKAAAMSIASIIERAIGAPISNPIAEEGAREADKLYPGSPAMRLAFNDGVKWVATQYEAQCAARAFTRSWGKSDG